MTKELETLVQKFEERRITRRELVGTLVCVDGRAQGSRRVPSRRCRRHRSRARRH